MSKPSIIQAFEQIGATMRDFAPVVRTYYDALRKVGFKHDDAMRLALAWQDMYWRSVLPGGKPQ